MLASINTQPSSKIFLPQCLAVAKVTLPLLSPALQRKHEAPSSFLHSQH